MAEACGWPGVKLLFIAKATGRTTEESVLLALHLAGFWSGTAKEVEAKEPCKEKATKKYQMQVETSIT